MVLRIALLSGIVLSTVWALPGSGGEIGISAESGSSGTHVSASASPLAIVIAISILLVFCVLLNTRARGHEFRIAPIWRRTAAFAIDFWVSLFVFGTLTGWVDLLLEAHRTGAFHWHFQRNYWVASDNLSFALAVVAIAAAVGYFLLPLMRCGQTVGSWIFRIVTVNLDGSIVCLPFSTAIRRMYSAFRGLISPVKTLRKRDEQGRTFYDIESGFTVVTY